MINKLTKLENNGYFNALYLFSYNPVLIICKSNRNYGKTWSFLYRAWKRAKKHGKKTVWLRVFKKEVKELSQKLYKSKDLQKKCGIIPYDSKTKRGNFKKIGHVCYIKKGNKWVDFLTIGTINDSNALRAADDVDTDTLIVDEYLQTADRLKRYRGNYVDDLLDIFISMKREHKVQIILLGNKEIINDPVFTYFNIPLLPVHFEGVKTYKNGSLIVAQIDNKPKEKTEYDKKVHDLLIGTKYGNYLYNGDAKNMVNFKPRKMPSNALYYVQLNWQGCEFKIASYNGYYYVNGNIDKTKPVYTSTVLHKYKFEYLLVKRQKRLFIALINAISDNRIYYSSNAVYEAIQQFYVWLGI